MFEFTASVEEGVISVSSSDIVDPDDVVDVLRNHAHMFGELNGGYTVKYQLRWGEKRGGFDNLLDQVPDDDIVSTETERTPVGQLTLLRLEQGGDTVTVDSRGFVSVADGPGDVALAERVADRLTGYVTT